jgi:hypothetical protein
MNTPIEFEGAQRFAMPAPLRPLLEPTQLLPGESQSDYATIRQMVIDEVAPQSSIEWLWTMDLIELSWDIVRYRPLASPTFWGPLLLLQLVARLRARQLRERRPLDRILFNRLGC